MNTNATIVESNEVIKYIEEFSAENLLEKSLIAEKLYYKFTKETSF